MYEMDLNTLALYALQNLRVAKPKNSININFGASNFHLIVGDIQ
jgi:hypothetical protein